MVVTPISFMNTDLAIEKKQQKTWLSLMLVNWVTSTRFAS